MRGSRRVAGVDSVGALGFLLVGAASLTNEQTLSLGLWRSGQRLCERTNLLVGALFVRSHRSHGMGRGFIDPFVRSFAGARWWSGRGWRAMNWLRPPLQAPCQARRKLHG